MQHPMTGKNADDSVHGGLCCAFMTTGSNMGDNKSEIFGLDTRARKAEWGTIGLQVVE